MTFALEKSLQSPVQGNPRVAESVREQPAWHRHQGISCGAGSCSLLFPAQLRCLQTLAGA